MKHRFTVLIAFMLAIISMNSNAQVTVTFKVNMGGYTVYSGGMHIAGTFLTNGSTTLPFDWDPSQGELTSLGNNLYSIDVTFPSSAIGNQLQFLFVRNNIWNDNIDYSEGNPGQTSLNFSCGVDDVCCGGFNRAINIPSVSSVFNCNWDHCGSVSTCAAPTNLSTTFITSNSAVLNWLPGFGAESYQIRYRDVTTNNWTIINVADPSTTSVGISNLSSSKLYYWQIKSNCKDESVWSKQIHFKTTEEGLRQEDVLSPLRLYPNPAMDAVNVEGLTNNESLQIKNMMGQIVWAGKAMDEQQTIDIRSLAGGSYYLITEGNAVNHFSVAK